METYVVCQRRNPPNRAEVGLVQSCTISDFPMDIIYIYLMGPLPKIHGDHRYIIIAVDHFSKFCVSCAILLKKASRIANPFVTNLFLIYSIPRKLVFDNGLEFCNGIVDQIFQILNV